MSRRRRRRTSPRFSPPSSRISSEAAPIEQADAEESPVIIRYAETDDDVIAIHRFLLVVLRPMMLCPVNPEKSLMEIIRVTKEEVALMAIKDGMLVGTLGLMRPVWWYGDEAFLCDRWQAVLPQFHHGEPEKLLEAEACQIAAMAGLKFVNYGKIRRKKDGNYILFPRLTDSKSDTPLHPGSA